MKNKFFCFCLLTSLLTNKVSSQEFDSLACKKFEDSLKIIQAYLFDNSSDLHMQRVNAVDFLVRITKIPTISPYSFIGAENPTNQDLCKWTEWYLSNKRKLKYDLKKNTFYLSND